MFALIFMKGSRVSRTCEWQPLEDVINYNQKPICGVHRGKKISDIKFASYGLPQGTCGSFREGSCHAHKSYDALKRNCIGHQSCSVSIVPKVFGGDPCPNNAKKLSVEAVCS